MVETRPATSRRSSCVQLEGEVSEVKLPSTLEANLFHRVLCHFHRVSCACCSAAVSQQRPSITLPPRLQRSSRALQPAMGAAASALGMTTATASALERLPRAAKLELEAYLASQMVASTLQEDGDGQAACLATGDEQPIARGRRARVSREIGGPHIIRPSRSSEEDLIGGAVPIHGDVTPARPSIVPDEMVTGIAGGRTIRPRKATDEMDGKLPRPPPRAAVAS